MSGKHKGVQQKVSQVAKYAYYVHCCAHRLNLVLVDCCKAVREAREFFSLLEKLYVFTSGSLMHIRWLEVQRRMYPSEQPRQLSVCLTHGGRAVQSRAEMSVIAFLLSRNFCLNLQVMWTVLGLLKLGAYWHS